MDLSQLSKLGKVGGVPGIALGAAVLVLGAVLGLTNAVPEAWRGPLLLVAALGAIAFGVLVLRGGSQVAETKGDRSQARNESTRGARQRATTSGKDAPAVNKQ
jgi:hypothetical protein